ncbi:MAG: tetratricopeptide (TPR) repeat protein, partial [Pseudohongiellaceae bacterium]
SDGSPDVSFDERNDLRDITLLTRLSRAELLVARGHYRQAIAALLDLRERIPSNKPNLATLTAQRLVHAYKLAGDGVGARDELNRLLAAAKALLPGDSPILDENLRIELAISEALNGSSVQSAADLDAIWKTRQQRLGPQHVDTILVAQSLAELLVRQGRHDEAEPLLRHVIEVRHTVSGAEHPQALEILDQLVPTSRRVLGPEHPHTVSMVCTLSAAAVQSGRADGHKLIEEALALGRRTLRADHPNMLTVLSNAGAVQGQQGHYEEAATLLREALALCDNLDSTKAIDRVLVMVNLSGILIALQESDAAGQHDLTLIGYDLGSTQISSLIATTGLGIVFTHTGRAEQGEALLRATKEVVLKTYGPDNNLALRCDEALADARALRLGGSQTTRAT